MMQRTVFAGIALLAVTLAGCQNQPEETPDITEAIPLDQEDEPAPEDGEDDLDPTGAQGSPFADDPEAPDATMESGSNADTSIYGGEDEGAPDPSRSKLQPADPPS